MTRTSQAIRFAGMNGSTLGIQFEPGGGYFEVPAGTYLDVVISGPEGERLEVAHSDDFVTIWPSGKLRVAVIDWNGTELPVVGYSRD